MYKGLLIACIAILGAAIVARVAVGSPTSAKTIKATLFFTGLTNVDADHNEKPSIGDYAIAPGFFAGATGKQMAASVPLASR